MPGNAKKIALDAMLDALAERVVSRLNSPRNKSSKAFDPETYLKGEFLQVLNDERRRCLLALQDARDAMEISQIKEKPLTDGEIKLLSVAYNQYSDAIINLH